MLSAPSRLSNTTVVRDRRPRRSSHNSSSVETVGGDLPSHPRRGGAPRTSSGVPPHPPRPRGGAVVPGFPRPPISQPRAGGVAPPIVRSSASHPRSPAVAFELQSLTTKSRTRGSDPATDNDGPIEAPDAAALQTRNARNAWATTTVTATVTTLAETNEQSTDTTTAEQVREPTSQLPPGPQESAEDRPDAPPLPLTPSDTNLPPVPPSPPPPPPPPILKALRPQRPHRTRRGCGAASENRSDESIPVVVSNIDPTVTVPVLAPPTECAVGNATTATDNGEDRETRSVETPELEDAGQCRRPTLPSAVVPARVEASFRARPRPRPRPRTLPLVIFCGSDDDAATSHPTPASLYVNIVPAHDDVPLTLRDYAALVGHVLMASEGAHSDDESSAQKAECILGAAVTRRENVREPNERLHVDAAAARDAD